jgi:hypothetical protein
MKIRSKYELNKINEYYINKKKIEIRKKYYNNKEGIINKIISNLRSRTFIALKNQNVKLYITYMNLLGCTINEYEEYLQVLFIEGMNYNNYGEWEIDHIIPISSFNLKDSNNLVKCFNYKNTQPLWKSDNRKKSNKLPNEIVSETN